MYFPTRAGQTSSSEYTGHSALAPSMWMIFFGALGLVLAASSRLAQYFHNELIVPIAVLATACIGAAAIIATLYVK